LRIRAPAPLFRQGKHVAGMPIAEVSAAFPRAAGDTVPVDVQHLALFAVVGAHRIQQSGAHMPDK